MNFLKKEKRRKEKPEPIYKVNGKIVLVSFDGLNPADFPYKDDLAKENIREQSILLSFDGRIFVNQNIEGNDALADLLEILAHETRYNLDQWQRKNKKRFANVTFDNVAEIQDVQKRAEAITYLLIPSEIIRRSVEKKYYLQK